MSGLVRVYAGQHSLIVGVGAVFGGFVLWAMHYRRGNERPTTFAEM